MDSFLFRKFKASLDDPEVYQQHGNHILLRKLKATIPVILSAPHGGGDRNFPTGTVNTMKVRPPGGKNVSMKSDLWTLQMLASIDQKIFELCGQRCYVVAANVHRRYVDANRNNAVASDENAHHPDCEESKAYYSQYHSCLQQAIEDCALRHPDAPCALLLDVHGQATFGDMVVLGTQNRRTCGVFDRAADSVRRTALVDLPLRGFIWHCHSLLGRVVLPHHGDEDIFPYRGGHIVCKYGTQEQEEQPRETVVPVSAVQLEFGSSLRSDSTLRGECLCEHVYNVPFPSTPCSV